MILRLLSFLLSRLSAEERQPFLAEAYLTAHGFRIAESFREAAPGRRSYYPSEGEGALFGFEPGTAYPESQCLEALASSLSVQEALCIEDGERVVEWKKRRAEGWVDAKTLFDSLGVEYSGNALATVLESITQHIDGAASESNAYPALYQPVTLEEIVTGRFFVPFLNALPTGNSAFILRCLTMPNAPAAALAHMIGK